MSVTRDIICRLCLRVLHNNFTLIDEIAREMLDVLFVKMNLDVSNDPLMCEECAEIVKRSLSFKLVCLGSEKAILWFCTHKNMTIVDLRDVYKHNSKRIVNGDTEICRFCIKKVKRSSFGTLDDLTKENTFSDMLKVYMFELDLNIIKNPPICFNCRDNMESYFKLLQNCRDTEEKINTYKQNERIRSSQKIMLGDVFGTFFKCTEKEELCNSLMKIKEEFDTKDEGVIDCSPCRNKEADDPKLCMCDTPDTEDIEIETVPSKGNNLTVKTEELVIKDEVSLSNTTGQQSKDCRICICKPKMKMCGKCNSQFEVVSKGPMVYKCKLCVYQGKSIKTHMVTHRNILEIQMYRCDSCEYETKIKKNLQRHSLVHKDSSEVQIYQCDICEYQTKRKPNLKNHLSIHKNSSVQIYQCDTCKYQTIRKGTLKRHLLIHKDSSEVQMYQCDSCEYQTKHKTNLKDHMLIHKDSCEVQMYQCDNCMYETKRKSNLKNHLLIHKDSSDVRIYHCDSCTYQTKHNGILKRHLLMHKDSE